MTCPPLSCRLELAVFSCDEHELEWASLRGQSSRRLSDRAETQSPAHQKDGETYKARLKKVKQLVRPCCHGCDDFSSEFSDISVGNVGSPNGWSTVVVRTKKGEEVLKAAEKRGLLEVKPIEEGKKGIEIVLKLANMKRSQAEEHAREKSSSSEE